MTLKQASDNVASAEGWMVVDGVRVYRDAEDTYLDETQEDAGLNDDTEVVDLGDDAYATK